MKDSQNGDVKRNIARVATALFSEKGYDGTAMNEIAQAAGVNKALIYYYFPSKQAVLDHIVDSFFDEMLGMGLNFIQNSITRLLKDSRMDILPDRMRFFHEEDLQAFKGHLVDYYKGALSHMLGRRDILRIILAEALRAGEQQDALLRFFRLSELNDNNPLYRAIADVDADFTYSGNVIFRKFFFSMMPMINFVVFHEDYKKVSGMSDDDMLNAYLNSIFSLYAGHFQGRDILMELQPDRPDAP